MDKTEHNNSPEYWETRFSTRDWDDAHGEAQTRFFGRLATSLLPSWALSDIRANRRVVADLGCAEGAATTAFAELLPGNRVIGVDFAASAIARARELHPGVEFQVGSLEAPPAEAEVLVLSNVLEHLRDPLGALRVLAARATTRYLVVLVPLQEGARHHEHVFTFDYNNFPVRLGRLALAHFDEVDLRGTPDERHWYGKQAFAIWASDDVLTLEGPTLNGLVGATQRSEARARVLRETVRRLEESDRKKLVELADARRQLTEAMQEVRKLELAFGNEERAAETSVMSGSRFIPDVEAERRAEGLARELAELRGTLKWRFSTRLAERLERSGLGVGLKLARSLDREGLVGTVQRANRAMRRRLRARTRPLPFEVDPWVSLSGLKPIDVKVIDRSWAGERVPGFAIVTTVRNEEDNILDFLRSIGAQRAAPTELIVVDGGSTDATVSILREFASTAPFALRVIAEGPCNIAAGRNRGLREVTEELVVFVDAGCRLRPDFFSAMVGPFSGPNRVDLVGGIYLAAPGAPRARDFIPDWQRCDFASFLPSARAVAVRTSLARAIGGFPEYLTHTGEDTLFDISYRRVSQAWVVNRAAVVEWRGPANEQASLKLSRSYSRGDGESGFGDRRFYRWLSEHQSKTLGRLGELDQAAFEGFLDGRRRRAMVEMERRKVRGVVVILESAQLTDFGGDRWVAHLTAELTRQAVKVVHVSALGPDVAGQRFLDLDQSMLELYHLNDFDAEELVSRYGERLLGVMVEEGHPALLGAAAQLHRLSSSALVSFAPDQVGAARVPHADRERTARSLAKLTRGRVVFSGEGNFRTLVISPAADLRFFQRSAHEARPSSWPIRWKERVVISPTPFEVTSSEGAALRRAARETPALGYVVLVPDWQWPELQKRWGVVERNVSGATWRTPMELASWTSHAAAVVMPWSFDSPERRQWLADWGARASAVGVPVIARCEVALPGVHSSSGPLAGEVDALLRIQAATPASARGWQHNAHQLISFLFNVGR